MGKANRSLIAIVGVLALLSCASFPALGATPKTKRVSVRSNGDQAEGGNSLDSSISSTGRFVAFFSGATNLVADDDNGSDDVFVHDRRTGKTKRVSVRSNGDQAEGGGSYDPSISADGRYVAFESFATNLVTGDSNDKSDVFVHDRRTGKTKRVSVRSNGDQAEDGNSYAASISGDGRLVAFESGAINLVAGDGNVFFDVFVHDRRTGKTKRVSVRSNGDEAEEGGSFDPSISSTGRFVAFQADATNLVSDDDNGFSDIFVHDRRRAKTKRVSVRSNGVEADDDSDDPSISSNGRFVSFESDAINLVADDDNGSDDIFVHDRRSAKTKRVSVRSNGDEAEGGGSYDPSISADGRFVSFYSAAINLVALDDNTNLDIFVHDRNTAKTKRVNLRSNGDQAEGGDSFAPSISATGGFISFYSGATNLVGNDDNGLSDVFVRGPLR